MADVVDEPEERNLDLDIPDDALAEIATTAPALTERERRYVYWRMVGTPPLDAFTRSGYSGSTWRTVETRPKIREAISAMHEKLEPEWRITQKTVVGLLMEAVDMSRRKDQAGNMIEAARALSDITGVGAAAKLQIQQNTNVSIEHRQEMQVLNQLPKHQLENLLEIKRTLPQREVIDAEYAEVYNHS